jgi:hypothetical protein
VTARCAQRRRSYSMRHLSKADALSPQRFQSKFYLVKSALIATAGVSSDQSETGFASPALTAVTPSISLSFSTSLEMARAPRSSRATVTVPFDPDGTPFGLEVSGSGSLGSFARPFPDRYPLRLRSASPSRSTCTRETLTLQGSSWVSRGGG